MAAPEQPTPITRLENALERLGLGTMRANLRDALDSVSSGSRGMAEAMLSLAEAEESAREGRAAEMFVSMAHLPSRKDFDDFDFSFQPSLPKDAVMSLRDLGFLDTADNVVFVGSPGVGKTHLASALGLYAAKRRITAYFTTFSDLVLSLKAARDRGDLARKMDVYCRNRLLIVDEVGFMPIDRDGAELFFQLVNKRYEKKSIVITTNLAFDRWGEAFGDPVLANAILDRLLHHCRAFKIVGRSYRTKDYAELDGTPAANP